MNTKEKKTGNLLLRNSKILFSLALAAVSMTMSGIILGSAFTPCNLSSIFFKIYTTIALVGVVYSFNDVIDNSSKFQIKRNYFSPILWSLALITSFFGTLYSNSDLSISLILCVTILLVGIVYSLEFRIEKKTYKIKNIFIIKNLFIAFGWALLIPFGSSNNFGRLELILFTFSFVQIFIGSVIRDMNDVEDDFQMSVESLPVRFGVHKTLRLLNQLNYLSAIFVIVSSIFISTIPKMSLALLMAVIWRFVLLKKIESNLQSVNLLQTLNLATCLIILLSQVISL